ncbi:hypothetical protein D8B29_06885 [Verminephrobacter eiseniae]|nr:hypothetical protein [Verminephrobacter eiseniae]MCW5305791.1 hypothetical protein [Verminephrobacter eiseniae]MCW8179355.1 hypothetical protein [Verminephrobacter eiseniae]MCW8191718.1 hypothetical protein [Verminephrobacter eiseniae]
MVSAILIVAGCSSEKVPSVADYMHDMDETRKILDMHRSNPAKYQSDARVQNAAAAWSAYLAAKAFSRPLSKCWASKPPTTAGTDHACLDNNKFKR